MLCDSIKVKDPMKVGRFGLGFKSVFHVTGTCVSDCVKILIRTNCLRENLQLGVYFCKAFDSDFVTDLLFTATTRM